MRCRHRVNASLKRAYEIGHRSAPLLGMGNDSGDGRNRVLDAMVELGIQKFLGLLSSLALGDVDADADDPLRARVTIVRNETTPFHPTNLTVCANNAVL